MGDIGRAASSSSLTDILLSSMAGDDRRQTRGGGHGSCDGAYYSRFACGRPPCHGALDEARYRARWLHDLMPRSTHARRCCVGGAATGLCSTRALVADCSIPARDPISVLLGCSASLIGKTVAWLAPSGA